MHRQPPYHLYIKGNNSSGASLIYLLLLYVDNSTVLVQNKFPALCSLPIFPIGGERIQTGLAGRGETRWGSDVRVIKECCSQNAACLRVPCPSAATEQHLQTQGDNGIH